MKQICWQNILNMAKAFFNTIDKFKSLFLCDTSFTLIDISKY